jgi:hypothetical protein
MGNASKLNCSAEPLHSSLAFYAKLYLGFDVVNVLSSFHNPAFTRWKIMHLGDEKVCNRSRTKSTLYGFMVGL